MAVLLVHREWLSSLTKIIDSCFSSSASEATGSASPTAPSFPRLWKRLAADCVDSCVLDILSLFIVFAEVGTWYWVSLIFKNQGAEELSSLGFWLDFWLRGADSNLLLALFALPRGLLSLFYYSEGHYLYGTTFGKRLFGIFVCSFDGFAPLTRKQAYLRTMHYLTSYATFGVGFFWAIFSSEKRALHDFLANTVCVVRARA